MKAVKIILALAVVAIICIILWKWLVNITPPPHITPPTNPFTAKIEGEIDSLKKVPVNVFCKKFYNDIQYLITDYHQKGFLGISYSKEGKEIRNNSHNDQRQEIFSKNLYSAYAPKFVEQAMYVFNGSEWNYDKLRFIRGEEKMLQSSTYLDPNSPVANSFTTIREILAIYDEIAGFISACNGFSYSNYELGNRFPDVSDKIQRSRAYLANNLNNIYVNKCTRLKDGLKEIPKKLFDKHISYLGKKINDNGGRYREYNYQSDYSNTIYISLRNQVDALNNETYGIGDNDFNDGYYSLDNLLSGYNRDATNYFLNLKNK